jgi:hypothetical protein
MVSKQAAERGWGTAVLAACVAGWWAAVPAPAEQAEINLFVRDIVFLRTEKGQTVLPCHAACHAVQRASCCLMWVSAAGYVCHANLPSVYHAVCTCSRPLQLGCLEAKVLIAPVLYDGCGKR